MASTISLSLGNVLVRPKVAHRTASFPPSTNLRSFVAVRASNEQDDSIETSRTLEECEAAAVAGNFPAPPPLVKPAGPKGTPKIKPLGVEIELFGKDGVTGMVPGQGEGPEVRRLPTSMILIDQSDWTVKFSAELRV